MRLIVLMNVYNEADNIAKAIESVHGVADRIHVFDGAYREYPHDKPYSTDDTREIATSYPKVVFHSFGEAWESQIIKRSAMFEIGEPGDVFFKLDGDEYVLNPEIIKDHLNCDVGWTWTLSNLYDQPYMVARIFKYRDGLHYKGRHHWLYDGHRNFITSDQHMNARFDHKDTPIRVFNKRTASRPENIIVKRQFLKNRNPQEQKYTREDRVYDKFVARFVKHPNAAGAPRKPFKTLKYLPDPDYTFTLMFSREWALERYFNCLDRLKIPPKTELVVVIDTDRQVFANKVIGKLQQVKQFEGVSYYVTGNLPLPEFSKVALRRQRIIDNWHYLMTEGRGEIFLGSEDDSLPQPDAYIRLLKTLEDEKAHFVQGNIIGRWKANMSPAWHVEEKDGVPYRVTTGEEKNQGMEQIQGTGWYCFVTYADVMRKFPMQTDELLPLGPDLRFGYNLSKAGYKLLHQWDVKVEHFGRGFSLLPGREKTKVFAWEKRNGKWLNA